MKVTIRDVAKEAGVSPSTVSRVLSNNDKISQETQKIVHKAIEKLNYRPNVIARSLANNKTRTLGIVLPNEGGDSFANPFFIQVMQGISQYVQEQHYYMMYAFCNNEEEKLQYIKEFSHNGMVDGIILVNSQEQDESIAYLKRIAFPFVVIGKPEPSKDILWVDNDNFGATYNLVNNMIARGHQQIGFIGAKEDWAVSKDRLEGYKRALKVNGIPYEDKWVYHGKQFNEQTGKEGMMKIGDGQEVTAIIATDDLIAIGVNHYFNQQQIEDVALVGFNNTILAQYQSPPLASIDINGGRLGYYASKLLIESLQNHVQTCQHYVIETQLIERKSYK